MEYKKSLKSWWTILWIFLIYVVEVYINVSNYGPLLIAEHIGLFIAAVAIYLMIHGGWWLMIQSGKLIEEILKKE